MYKAKTASTPFAPYPKKTISKNCRMKKLARNAHLDHSLFVVIVSKLASDWREQKSKGVA